MKCSVCSVDIGVAILHYSTLMRILSVSTNVLEVCQECKTCSVVLSQLLGSGWGLDNGSTGHCAWEFSNNVGTGESIKKLILHACFKVILWKFRRHNERGKH